MPLLRHFAVIASGPFNVEWVGFCFGRSQALDAVMDLDTKNRNLMRPIGLQSRLTATTTVRDAVLLPFGVLRMGLAATTMAGLTQSEPYLR